MTRFTVAALLLGLAATAGCKQQPTPPVPTRAAAPAASAPPSAPAPSAQAFGSQPPSWSVEPYRLPLRDSGIYSEFDSRVVLRLPEWLHGSPAVRLVAAADSGGGFIYVAGVPIGYSAHALGPVVGEPGAKDPNDADQDGIPDAVDILVGGKKTVHNGAAYRSTYRQLPYPGGDVPRTEGVCTDVVIRALRNAGLDLQLLVHEDIQRAPAAYPMVQRPDRSIDHRRVRTLVPYFTRHWERLPTDPRDTAHPYLPGDVVILDTLPGPGPEHLGIVSDQVGQSGLPLIINNWTDGYTTSEMDLLSFVKITHRFRAPARQLPVVAEHRGAAGLLRRHRIALPAAHRQLVLVHAPLWTSSGGTLRRYECASAEADWRPVGEPVPVRLGRAGLGRGRGLHDGMPGAVQPGPDKAEGDRRSPAGVFTLGTAFGPGQGPTASRWPWRATDEHDRFVDDPASPQYNTWRKAGEGPWQSAEKLRMYRLAVVVHHNTDPVQPGAGSAIFLHVWGGADQSTVGCTSMDRSALEALIGWLAPEAEPVLVQLPGTVF